MPIDKAYLAWHGSKEGPKSGRGQWRVQVAIPRHLHSFMGKARLVVPLHTDSLALANREKYKHVHALKQQIAKAEIEAKRKGGAADPIVAEALTWRTTMAEAQALDAATPEPNDEFEAERAFTQADGIAEALEARHDELTRTVGHAKAADFVTIATARGTPISALVADWLLERPMRPRQKLDYGRAVTKLEAWAIGPGKLTGMAEVISKREAGAYKTMMVRAGVNWRTANKDISALSMFWKWLVTRGIAQENIWQGMLLPKLKPADGHAKRPYTDAEVARLLSGRVPSVALKDTMTIAALSGMRIEEIVRMRVGDIKGDLVDLKGTKTAAARRIVPIHPDC